MNIPKEDYLDREGIFHRLVQFEDGIVQIINTSETKALKLYTIYSPPEHPDGLIQNFQTFRESDRTRKNKTKFIYLSLL